MSLEDKWARLAGSTYLVTIICGVYAEVVARGERATAAHSVFASDAMFRSGLIADLFMLAAYIVVTVLFHQMFREVSNRISAVAAAFSLVGIAVLACNTFFLALILRLPDAIPPEYAGPDIALLLLRAHGDGYKISLVFFGIYCLLLNWLIWRSRFIPRLVGLMVAAAGACNVINSLVRLGAPQLADYLPGYFTLPTLLGELALAVWLLLFGIRRPEERR